MDRYYEREFLPNDKGKCEAVDMPTSLEILCSDCRAAFLDAYTPRGCYNRSKYIVRSDVADFRDIHVCGTHKRHLLSEDKPDNYYAADKWYVVDDPEVKRAIKLLQKRGYNVELEKDVD